MHGHITGFCPHSEKVIMTAYIKTYTSPSSALGLTVTIYVFSLLKSIMYERVA